MISIIFQLLLRIKHALIDVAQYILLLYEPLINSFRGDDNQIKGSF